MDNFGAYLIFKGLQQFWHHHYLMITMVIINIQHDYHDHYHRQVLIFSALTYMSEKEIASTSFTSVIDAFW